jgi:hypothetical protein
MFLRLQKIPIESLRERVVPYDSPPEISIYVRRMSVQFIGSLFFTENGAGNQADWPI